MGEVVTPRLSLTAPDPGTSEAVDVADHLVANWAKVDGSIGAIPCTEGTKPGAPWDGMIIRTTDTRRVYVWNAGNSAWDQVMAAGGTFSQAPGGSTATVRGYLASGSATANRWMGLRGSADVNDRFILDYDGAMQWGPGSSGGDIGISRVSGPKLRASGEFQAGSAIPVDVFLGTSQTTGATSYTGLAQHGTTFIAPPSGAVWVTVNGDLGTSSTVGTEGSYMGYQLRAGGTIASGTIIQDADDDRAAFARPSTTSGFKYISATVRRMATGLTPGSTYNVRTMVRTTNASYDVAVIRRYLCVEPIYSL